MPKLPQPGRVVILFFLLSVCFVFSQTISPSSPEEQRTAWYRDAKFGMFIHWGPYSLASVEASWPIMRPSKEFPITEPEYRSLPDRFNPQHFDPYAWVALAKAAGQRYMVFTTKHHDGFCMFDSQFTDHKITKTPYGKDIVAQLAEACKREKMPLGFYYSPPDMSHPAFRDITQPTSKNWQGEPTRPEWPLYLDYMELQLRELLTRYGDVALIWFDGLYNQGKYDGVRMQRVIHQLQPQTLINNRIGIAGDFETPEQFLPASIPVKGKTLDFNHRETGTRPDQVPSPEDFRLWETCMTINHTWAYNKNDRDFKSSKQLVRTLIEVASRGGNFLLNVGPQPDGGIQPEFQERLLAIGKWLSVNGDSIYGTTYGPLQNLSFGRTTSKGRYIYLHVFDWPSGPLSVPQLTGKVASVTLLAGDRAVSFEQQSGNLIIQTTGLQPDPYATVFKLRMQ
ncbi:MAG TPA: alpha-L-fucosidase [Bryobacteraceae bacterium]|jgi:alpha-L-fucosidase|nr:alpha-L-fucosidase [Bryobacteraceae bacterium]